MCMEVLTELKYRYQRDVLWSDAFSFVVLLLGALCLLLTSKFLVFINLPLTPRIIILIVAITGITLLESYVIYKIRTAWRWWRFLLLITAAALVSLWFFYMIRGDDTVAGYWLWGFTVFITFDVIFRIFFLPFGKVIVKEWKTDYMMRAVFKWIAIFSIFTIASFFLEYMVKRQYQFSIFEFIRENFWTILPIVVALFTFFATGFLGPKRNVFYVNQSKVHEELLPLFKQWCTAIQTVSAKPGKKGRAEKPVDVQSQIDNIVFVKGANNTKFMWQLLTYFSSRLDEPIADIMEKEKLKLEIKEDFKNQKVRYFFDSACVCFAETSAQRSGTSGILRNFTLEERGFDRLETWAHYLSLDSNVSWEKYSVLENTYSAYKRKKASGRCGEHAHRDALGEREPTNSNRQEQSLLLARAADVQESHQ